jgi:hypothetical protein
MRTRKIEATTPGYEKVFVVVSPTFGVADKVFRAAESFGLNVRLTAGDYRRDEIRRIYHQSKDGSYIVVHLESPLFEWDYDQSEEYQMVHLPKGKSAADTVMDMFHSLFGAAQVEGEGNAA